MKIIYKSIAASKTTEAIKYSAETGHYIVCRDMANCDRIFQQAKKSKLNIPFPISYSDLLNNRYYERGVKGFIIDNADDLLQSITSVQISMITLTKEKRIRNRKKIKPIKSPYKGSSLYKSIEYTNNTGGLIFKKSVIESAIDSHIKKRDLSQVRFFQSALKHINEKIKKTIKKT